MFKGIIGTAAIYFFLIPCWGLSVVKTPEVSVMCRNQKEVRTLRVEILKDGTCRSIYTKAGKDQKIGAGQNFQSCEEFVQKVRDVLEGAYWKCREVEESRVSNIIDNR